MESGNEMKKMMQAMMAMESNDQGGAVQRKARRLSEMADEAKTTLYNGQHGTLFGEDFVGEVTHQRNNGVR